LAQERIDLERRLAELADSERRLRELEALPSLVEEYLRELPHLLDLKPLLREYETSAPEAAQDDPLYGLVRVPSLTLGQGGEFAAEVRDVGDHAAPDQVRSARRM
jgi:hypothetical protein